MTKVLLWPLSGPLKRRSTRHIVLHHDTRMGTGLGPVAEYDVEAFESHGLSSAIE